jgi:uncharacterized membrane protein YhiD involved in acid resistance
VLRCRHSPKAVLVVLLTFLLGAAIGAEREWWRHPGGLLPCALVSAAACVFARSPVEHGVDHPGAAWPAEVAQDHPGDACPDRLPPAVPPG